MGNPDDPTPGGSGNLIIDDIRIFPDRCLNLDHLDLSADQNGDCIIDYKDMADLAGEWLDSGMSTTP